MIRRMFLPLLLLVLLQTGAIASQSESGNDTVASFDGVEVVYETRGKGEPTIVFVHGWANNRSVWRDQLGHFAQRYRVVAMDLPGFGKSGNDREDWTMAAYGKDVKAVVDAVEAKKPLVLEEVKIINLINPLNSHTRCTLHKTKLTACTVTIPLHIRNLQIYLPQTYV